MNLFNTRDIPNTYPEYMNLFSTRDIPKARKALQFHQSIISDAARKPHKAITSSFLSPFCLPPPPPLVFSRFLFVSLSVQFCLRSSSPKKFYRPNERLSEKEKGALCSDLRPILVSHSSSTSGSTRMDVGRLQRELLDHTSKLLEEGVIDKQFMEIQSLRDESNPDFPSEVVYIFFEDAQKLIDGLCKAFQQPQYVDFGKISNDAHQLKGSSSSVGAKRITDVCMTFRRCCDEYNLEGCFRCLQQLKYEFSLFKNKLEYLFKLEKQIVAAGGSLPAVES